MAEWDPATLNTIISHIINYKYAKLRVFSKLCRFFLFFQLLRGSENICRNLSFIRIEMWARFPFGVEKAKILCEEVANLSIMLCRFC